MMAIIGMMSPEYAWSAFSQFAIQGFDGVAQRTDSALDRFGLLHQLRFFSCKCLDDVHVFLLLFNARFGAPPYFKRAFSVSRRLRLR